MIVTVTKDGLKMDVDKCGECPFYNSSPKGLGWCGSEMMDIYDVDVIHRACPFNYKGNIK